MPVNYADFPDECWESVFRFLGNSHDLESVSMVCKNFKSITSRLQSSLTIFDPTIQLLPNLFFRFTRLKMLDLSHFSGELEEQGLLRQISRSGLDLDSLNLSNQRTLPVDGLRELGSKMKSLKIFICSNIGILQDSHLVVMAYCFPLLQEIDISFPLDSQTSDFGVSKLSSMLESLRKINLSGNHLITDQSLFSLCQNCMSLEEISIFTCFKMTQFGIASAIRLRPSLTSISFNIEKRRIHGPGLAPMPINLDLINSLACMKRLTAIDLSNSFISDDLLFSVGEECHMLKKLVLQDCCNFTFSGVSNLLSKCQLVQFLDLRKVDFLTDQSIIKISMFLHSLTSINLSGCCQLTNSTFFTLTRKCPLLIEIKMERTYLGVEGDEEEDALVDPVSNTQVKSLYLGNNALLGDESLIEITSVCPNLEILDLSSCVSISGECVAEVLRRCNEIRHLNIAYSRLKHFEVDFEVSQLKVLNLSGSRIDNGTLSIISRMCCGLVLLDIQNCSDVTENGVREIVENCIALRELNLKNCGLVCDDDDDFVASLAFSRPTLRKIITSSGDGVHYF